MKYIVGVIAVVFITILAIILIVTRSPEPSTTQVKTGEKVLAASDYATKNATASLTIRGRLVGESERRAVRISVTPSTRTIEELAGYDERVVRTQTYANSQAGYEEFLKALDNAGFNRKRDSAVQDEQGICPLGRTYILAINEGASQPLRLWTTTCGTKSGTAAAPIGTIQQIYQNQIPDYAKFVSPIRL